MTHRFLSLLAAGALSLAASASLAAESGVIHNAKTVGALTLETRGLATSPADVRRQGGFASAGAVQWTRTPAVEAHANAF